MGNAFILTVSPWTASFSFSFIHVNKTGLRVDGFGLKMTAAPPWALSPHTMLVPPLCFTVRISQLENLKKPRIMYIHLKFNQQILSWTDWQVTPHSGKMTCFWTKVSLLIRNLTGNVSTVINSNWIEVVLSQYFVKKYFESKWDKHFCFFLGFLQWTMKDFSVAVRLRGFLRLLGVTAFSAEWAVPDGGFGNGTVDQRAQTAVESPHAVTADRLLHTVGCWRKEEESDEVSWRSEILSELQLSNFCPQRSPAEIRICLFV